MLTFTPRHLILTAQTGLLVALSAMLWNVAPDTAHAATAAPAKFEVSGWIPYWRTATGTADVLPHLNQLTEINPFGYTVKQDGSLYDAADIGGGAWDTLIAAARAQKVRVIPTVMWSDTDAIDTVLRSPTLRAAHVAAIVKMVNDNNFDGVDIDYEGKKAEDRPYFSAFLKQLYAAMGKKYVMCTIEARTPVSSRYLGTPPADATNYANDLVQINKYCDRVKLMTYDQQSVDVALDAANKGKLYAPVADPAWITKVVALMSKDISKSKIELGIATYGYIYQLTPNASGTDYNYDLIESFNPRYATDLATSLGITPIHNSVGEESFTYIPETAGSGYPTNAQLSAMAGPTVAQANRVAAGALVYAQLQQRQVPITMLDWSDSGAIASKVALARKLGLRGVAVFKFDGGEDPNMWSVLK